MNDAHDEPAMAGTVTQPVDRQPSGLTAAQVVPAVVGLAASTWWRATTWSVATAWRAGSRLIEAAAKGEPPTQLLGEAGANARSYARRFLGIVDVENLVRTLVVEPARGSRSSGDADTDTNDDADTEPQAERSRGLRGLRAAVAGNGRASAVQAHGPERNGASPTGGDTLRAMGAELLRRSADVDFDEEIHPAYVRILGDLAPDEARILRLLWLDGPQPAVDVRTAPLLTVGSQLIEPGLSMIGSRAGCRYPDRVPRYLNNLNRLGLVWFSREPVIDSHRYQVLEVQPAITEAKRRAGRGRTVRRSIHLTPFGKDLCDVCLPPIDDPVALPATEPAGPMPPAEPEVERGAPA